MDLTNLLTLYGNASSEAMLDFPCRFFQLPQGKGAIAYRIEAKCAVIFGDPLCPSKELPELLQAFHEYCNDSDMTVIYITVSEKFARIAAKYCPILIEPCDELIFNPQLDPCLKSHRLKHRVEKAVKHGLTFHEYVPFDQTIENELLFVGSEWRKAKKGVTLYLGHLNFFENPKGKRWFYVKDGQQITAMAMLSQLDAQKGWLLKFFCTLPGAFQETSEFLMISLLNTLKEENCSFLTKGVVPKDALGELTGLGYRTKLIQGAFNVVSSLFKFPKHKQYWERYFPEKAPSYVLFSSPKIGFNQIRALLQVLKVGK